MDAQEHNSCLVNMPVLVLEKILSNFNHLLNFSLTCKRLYEIVCGMEIYRRVMYISALDASPLNIDADAVFDSIMNSHRTIKKIELRLDAKAYNLYELNERQLVRITAIMKQFGANVTSLEFYRFNLPLNFILELLQQAPKLEALTLTNGKVMGSITENPTMSLQLSSLKSLELDHFVGLLDIVNLIPDGSLTSIRYADHFTESTEVLASIFTNQYSIKSVEVLSHFDLTALYVDHLQLETLVVKSDASHSQFLKILKWQTNLKELRFLSHHSGMSGSVFQWICNNLKKLEVFQVQGLYALELNAFEMLGELKLLRHFSTYVGDYLFDNGFQSFQFFKSDSIEKFEFGFSPEFSCGERLNNMVNSMARNLPNLTHLKMHFENFSALCFVLSHCTKIVHLSSYIRFPISDELTLQRFPYIQHLELCYDYSHYGTNDEVIRQNMTSIVPVARAMPNLKSMSLLTQSGLKFDVKTMKEFFEESKSLEYFYVDWFVLHRELSADDVVETIRSLIDQLKGYHINFSPSTLPQDFTWHEIKEILSNELSVRYNYRNLPCFYLYKGGEKKFRALYF